MNGYQASQFIGCNEYGDTSAQPNEYKRVNRARNEWEDGSTEVENNECDIKEQGERRYRCFSSL